MNLNSGIEWTEATWNPVVGCEHGCGMTADNPEGWCYARRMSKRQPCPKCRAFVPHLHPERLDQPIERKKPTTIFAGSTCDLWGDWVPADWIEKVLAVIRQCPQHRFLMLTKNPDRYLDFQLPENLWAGVTVTKPTMQDSGFLLTWTHLPEKQKRFISLEPLLSDVQREIMTFRRKLRCKTLLQRLLENGHFDWLIIGPLNKRGHDPVTKAEWVERIIEIADSAGVPVFLKDALWKKGIMTEAEVKARQELPWGKE